MLPGLLGPEQMPALPGPRETRNRRFWSKDAFHVCLRRPPSPALPFHVFAFFVLNDSCSKYTVTGKLIMKRGNPLGMGVGREVTPGFMA